uniref:Uncharacterized protein n=1 Tax=Lotharella globosa TaxID=91324 RepID=A0A7S3YZM5_9EUKA
MLLRGCRQPKVAGDRQNELLKGVQNFMSLKMELFFFFSKFGNSVEFVMGNAGTSRASASLRERSLSRVFRGEANLTTLGEFWGTGFSASKGMQMCGQNGTKQREKALRK